MKKTLFSFFIICSFIFSSCITNTDYKYVVVGTDRSSCCGEGVVIKHVSTGYEMLVSYSWAENDEELKSLKSSIKGDTVLYKTAGLFVYYHNQTRNLGHSKSYFEN